MMKKWMAIGLIACLGGVASAEPMRTALTKENRLPRLYQAEASVEFLYRDFEDNAGDILTIAPQIRYTLVRDFAVFARLPYHRIDPQVGSRESGMGDASVGVEFLAFKNLFGYPWIMPHGEVIFDNGNENKGLGTGETEYLVGVAAGTTVNRDFHFAADLRYLIQDDADNVPSIAASLVWDLDSRFSLIAELEIQRVKMTDFMGNSDTEHHLTMLGGMHYRASRALQFTLQGGTGQKNGIEAIFRGNVSYSF